MVGLEKPGREEEFTLEMKELALLAQTAGAEVVAIATQRRLSPDPAFYIGRGKAVTLVEMVPEKEANLVIFNDALSPSQVRNLEELLECKTIDRTALILDIFARRARSREGKLQVELAQLQYLLPHLIGAGVQLSRLGGGIGTRGPGETQLEVDRRRIRQRIGDLKREIEELRRHRALHRQRRRKNIKPVAALAGYTNAGKSTLLNSLTGAGVYTENKLFATLDPTVRRGEIAPGRTVLFTDTVGFIHRLPPQLWSAFQATLEEITASDLILHIVDASVPNFEDQIVIVREHLGRLDPEYFSREVLVFNKMDRVPAGFNQAYLKREYPECCFVSALNGIGLKELRRALVRRLDQGHRRIHLYLPYQAGRLLAQLRRTGRILSISYLPNYCEVEAMVDRSMLAQLHPYTTFPAQKPGKNSGKDKTNLHNTEETL